MTVLLKRLIRPVSVSRLARALLYSCFVVLADGALYAQAPARYPVTPQHVLLAMQGRDWPLDEVQIRLGAPVTAAVKEPALEISSLSQGHGHEVLLRMSCRVHSECLPFYASAMWPAEAPKPALLIAAGKHSVAVMPPDLAKARAGSHATLLLEDGPIHVRLPVVLAQSGHVGDTVRVITPDHKQTYQAELLSSELLKGELQR